ncbi:unnamed protein product [Orchesella dallaii]|uniref:PRORP domain-containing protein n=1 Tax=Orchesella dallaii TaxID=48710 RepID=A0ABP1R0Z0_9HEXA
MNLNTAKVLGRLLRNPVGGSTIQRHVFQGSHRPFLLRNTPQDATAIFNNFPTIRNSSSSVSHHEIKRENKYNVDINELESTVSGIRAHVVARALVDVWVERMTLICKEFGFAELMDANLDWSALINRCKELDHILNKDTVGGVIMNSCLKHQNFALAHNYMNWNRNPTLSVLTNFMKICGENIDVCGGEDRLIQIYEKIKTKNKGVWDRDSGERVIYSICKTRLWKDSFEILEAISVGGEPSPSCYGNVAEAAFRNYEFDVGWKILHEQANRPLPDEPFVAWLNACDPTEENMKTLLEFMDMYDQYGYQKLSSAIKVYYSTNLGYKAEDTDAVPDGVGFVCKVCKNPLNTNTLSDEEFRVLQDHFFNRVLKSEDLFMNTTGEELQSYKTFIEETGPFDWILDGLNVSYCKARSGNSPAGVLWDAVRHFNSQRGKILIIGRKHMMQWAVKYINRIRRNSRLYLINDDSEDDPFLIWATLKSGPRAKLISNDLLRNHSFRLQDPELGRLFKRWRLSQQLSINVDNRGRTFLRPFVEIVPSPQKNPITGHWHVPCEQDTQSPYDVPNKWICLSPTVDKQK